MKDNPVDILLDITQKIAIKEGCGVDVDFLKKLKELIGENVKYKEGQCIKTNDEIDIKGG